MSRGVIGVSLLQAVIAAVGMSAAEVPGASVLTVLILALGIVQIGPWIIGAADFLGLDEFADPGRFDLHAVHAHGWAHRKHPGRFALSHGLKTPMPVTFVGVIGGVLTHGIGGLFMGPVVLAVAWEVVKTWIEDEGVTEAEEPAQEPLLGS